MPIEILMPSAGAGTTEGALARWTRQPGERVARGDVLAEVETDKALMEVEAPQDGVLGRILVAEGTQGVAAGTVIGLLLAQGESLDAASATPAAAPTDARAAAPAAPASAAAAPKAAATATSAASGAPGRRVVASPLARRIAAAMGVELAAVAHGSGPRGRVLKADVVQAAASGGGAASRAEAAAGEDIPHTNARRVIAQRLTAAKQSIPHFYLTVDFDVEALLALRRDLAEQAGVKPSVNDFVVRAVALALAKHPNVNASWGEEAVRRHASVDVSVAVATDGGLVTPVVRGADRKSVATISAEVADLARRAREGRLKVNEIQGGGITVSNLGMYGIREFAAIINPPQSCILAVGASQQRPVVRDGALAVGTLMTCTLSADHRVVDGAVGAEFLATLRGLVEAPLSLLA